MKLKINHILFFIFLLAGASFAQETITVSYPNGNERIKIGNTINILWESNQVANVNIYLSYDGGTSWSAIASNVQASLGRYTWFIDSTTINATQQAKIRISDVSQSSVRDESDNNFTLSKIHINYPFSDETIQRNSATTINWETSNDISLLTLQFSENGGDSWQTIETNINSLSENSYIYNFDENATIEARIRIYDESDSSNIFYETGNFTIAELELTSPNGGEELKVGNIFTIGWQAENIPFVKLEYSVDGGAWNTIEISVNGGLERYSWEVPDVLSSQVLVKISDAQNSDIFDISESDFTIENLQIVEPNSSDFWEIGEIANITWNSNINGNIDIELSIDGGNTFPISIAENIDATLGFYQFIVPDNPTNLAIVRISENSQMIDESDGNFTIGTISIQNPFGGENWAAGTYKTISWTNTEGIEVVTIDYSTDGGNNWNTIKSSYSTTNSGGSYSWYIPFGVWANSAIIRVYDAVTSLGKTTNISNPFSIASIQITSPLNATIYNWGDVLPITWRASANITDVRIEYSTDWGNNYTLIENGIPSVNGNYNWTIPNGISSSGMKIRITAEENSSYSSTNSGYFTIGNVQLLTPNGTEDIIGGITYPITWTATSSVAFIRLEYSTDGGNNYTNIPGAAFINAANGNYNWTVPFVSTTQARIRISDSQTGNLVDASDSDFTIGLLQITNPTSGQAFSPNQAINITWNAENVSNVTLEFSSDGGNNWETIVAGINANLETYSWEIPTSYTNNAVIRISDFNNSSNYQLSGYFRITNLQLTYPNGGEIFQSGKEYQITYNYSTTTSNVNFELSLDEGLSWMPIESYVAASGSYIWLVGNVSTNLGRIRIVDSQNSSILDESNANFTIKQLRLTFPNGGNYFLVDSNSTINWISQQVNNIKIEYSTDNGGIWYEIESSVPADVQSYNWIVPNTSTQQAILRLADADYPQYDIADTSDNTFEINQFYITNPNGGQSYVVSENVTIQWHAHSSVATVRLDYSTNNGISWNLIANGVQASDLEYIWNTPNVVTTEALIRIVNESDVDIYDQSNANFSIGSITLTSPNGGEKWQLGSTQPIQWQNISSISNIDILLSEDNGSNWTTIASNINANLESWDWLVDEVTTGQALIRIQNSLNSDVFDESNSAFSIADINITAPNGSENYQTNQDLAILWNSSNVNLVTIQYSDNNGSNWFDIASGVSASSGEYHWTVPLNLVTNGLLIRIYENDFPTVLDISDASASTHRLVLTSPTNAEGWTRGENYNIEWEIGNVSRINLDYSSDGGENWNSITTNYLASNLSYSWLVPDTLISVEGLILISDTNLPEIKDSNATYFRTGKIEISLPNTSTIAQGGSVQQVTWVADSSITNVQIEYTVDNANWFELESSYTASVGIYSFVLPNTSTSVAKVRISDATQNSDISDESDFFTINNLQLTYPTSSSLWMNENNYDITWTSSNIINVGLQLSVDNGNSWQSITASTSAATRSYSWFVPDSIDSREVRIKIYDADNISAFDSSEAFTIGSIEINSPELLDVWQYNRYYQIKWNSSQNLGQLRLEYSTNGTNWNFISFVNSTDSVYNWRITQIQQSASVYLRLYDSDSDLNSDDFILDVSPIFGIANLDLQIPGSTTQWQANSIQQITWANFDNNGLLNTVSLFVSWNNGNSWETIANNVNYTDYSYDWTIPDTTSNQVRLKIVSDDYSTIYDSVASAFRISDLEISNITTATEFQANRSHQITWNYNFVNRVTLSYSVDNGNNWNTIIQNLQANTNSYNWQIPNGISTNQAIIRIFDSQNSNIINLSEVFTIKNLDLTSPNGSETWDNDNLHSINWNYGLVNRVNLSYSLNSGQTWTDIILNQDVTAGTYSWLIPSNLSSSTALIRIIDSENPEIRDSSQQVFNIVNFELTNPVGGEKWQVGKTYPISWQIDNSVSSASLQYSINGGMNWNEIAGNFNPTSTTTYNWEVPSGSSTNQALIRISDNSSGVYYESGFFTIVDLSIQTPRVNEYINSKFNYEITWTSNYIDEVKIQYSTDNVNWNTIVDSVSSALGSYIWVIPSSLSSNTTYLKIIDLENANIFTRMNSPFTVGQIEVTSPNGGEVLQSGQTHTITWDYSSSISRFNIKYSVDDGTNWVNIASGTTSAGSYNWLVPSSLSEDSILIRILDANSGGIIADTSDSYFSVNTLAITSPVGNENLQVGKTLNITWNSGTNVSNVDLEYRTSSNLTWQSIASNLTASDELYGWIIPNISDDNVRIRLKSSINSQISDTSEIFRIANVMITEPNSSESWQVGDVHAIEWTKSSNVSSVNLYYKTETEEWKEISLNNQSVNNQYLWTIPNDVSEHVNILLEDGQSANIFDTLETEIVISNLAITNPTNSTNWIAGTTQNINWTATSDIRKVAVYYSIDSGNNWVTISDSTNSDGSLGWNIPSSISSDLVKIRINDIDFPEINDTSADFSVTSASLNLTSPNGNAFWQVGKEYKISWTATSNITLLNLYYSSDGGNNWNLVVPNLVASLNNYQFEPTSAMISDSFKVKIEDAINTFLSDSSRNNNYVRDIQILSPQLGEHLQANRIEEILWQNSSNVTNVLIQYSADGTNWVTLPNTPIASNTSPYNWLVSNLPTTSGRIRITDAQSNFAIVDTSDIFSVSSLTFLKPNSYDIYQNGDSVQFTWENSSDIQSLQFFYSYDRTNWNLITTQPISSLSEYWWNIDANICGDSVWFKILDSNYPSVYDSSATAIGFEQIQIISPNSDDNWQVNTNHIISWTTCNVDSISIKYSTNGGDSWYKIADSIDASSVNSYTWLVPNIETDSALIKIYDIKNQEIEVFSEYFGIYDPTLELIYPNGNQHFQAGKTYPIIWNSELVEQISIEYSLDNGTNWTKISFATEANLGKIDWQVPDTIFSSSAKIRIINLSSPFIRDSSSTSFKISQINLLNPNASEYLEAGKTYKIKWNASDTFNRMKILYSTNGGSIWNTISGGTNVNQTLDSLNWTVPNSTASNQTQIKIQVQDADSINSISSYFNTGWVNLLSPNGGEIYLNGKNLEVQWQNGNSTKEILVEIIEKTDRTILVSKSDSAKFGFTNILIPPTYIGDSLFVRISDFASDYEFSDSSSSVFAVTHLTIIKPDENSNWNSGSKQVIEWQNGNYIDSLDFEYSLDNGQIWTTFATKIPSNQDTLHWILPDKVNSPNCLVRVFESDLTELADTSEKFEIYQATLELFSLLGNEKINAGKPYQINWGSKYITNIMLEVSYNAGRNWDTLSTSIFASDSTWNWNVPSGISTDSALIRISDATDFSLHDESTNYFSIGWINIQNPVNGTNWLAERRHEITWTHSQSVRKVNLFYSLTNSTLDEDLVPIATNINATDSSYFWEIPHIFSQNANIVIKDSESEQNLFNSSDRFIIGILNILTPNGGEFIKSGTDYEITWEVTDQIYRFLKIAYSIDGGNSWLAIANNLVSSDSSYLWSIPDGISSDSATIRIQNSANSSIYDTSSSFFNIGGLEITSHNSFDKYLENSYTDITWSASTNISRVDIHYKTNENVWKPVALALDASLTNFHWKLPKETGDSCYLRIRDNGNPYLYDYSNSNFAIAKLTLSSLNNGGVFQLGKNLDIYWESEYTDFLSFEFSTDSTNWTRINSTSIIGDSGHYVWQLPDNISYSSPSYLVRFIDEDFPNIADTSNQIFTLSYLKLISPNGGSEQQIGTSHEILWSASENTISMVNLYVEINQTWLPIQALIPTTENTYDWVINTDASPSSRIKIEDSQNNSIYDISDSSFVISHLEIIFPNGGNAQKLQVGRTYEVSWESTYINNLIMQYSANNGLQWNLVGISPAENNSYLWTIPNSPSEQALFKISDLNYNSVYDESDNNFSIVSLRVTSPNIYTAYNIGTTHSITWESTNLDSVRIQLSIDGGNTYPIEIAQLSANQFSYNWTIPNISSSNARIRITDIYDNLVSDESDTTFLMGTFPVVIPVSERQSKTINLLYELPNVGEELRIERFYFRSLTGNNIDGRTYLLEDYSNLVAPAQDTIKWNSLGQLPNFEGNIIFQIRFQSDYSVYYDVIVDTILIDNKAPTFNNSSFVITQSPEIYGWDVALTNWESAVDSSQPVLYDLYVSENTTFPEIPLVSNYGEIGFIRNLANYTTYYFKIVLTDLFGNKTSFTKSYKTKILADYDNLGNVDVIDLTNFVTLWSSVDSTQGVDLYPYTGTIPKPTVNPDDILNAFDLLVFRDMWIYDKYNNLLPKTNYSTKMFERNDLTISGKQESVDFNFEINSNSAIGGSAELLYNSEIFNLDSIRFLSEMNESDLFVLTFVDTTQGRIIFDFASLSGELTSNKYSIHASVNSNLSREVKSDSILFIYKSIEKDRQITTEGKVFSLNYVPDKFKLYQNYPNPFNPSTTIEFDVPKKSRVNLKLYNILGEEIFTIVNKELNAGNYREIVDLNRLKGLASGVYFYRIIADNFVQTKKMILLK